MFMENKNYSLETLAVHTANYDDPVTHANVLPIYQTAAYNFESSQYATDLFSLQAPGNIYSRLSNPTASFMEEAIATLEGGAGAMGFSSGHATIFSCIINLAEAGDEIVSSICIYGGAINLLGVTLGNLGIKVKFVNPDNLEEWENAVTEKTKAFFVETIGNPNANVADLEGIAEIAHRHGIPFIVDSTFTTPYLVRPIQFGADMVIHSATKFLGGHGTTMAGIVVDSGKFPFAGNPRFPQYNEPTDSYHGVRFAEDFQGAPFIARLRALINRDIGACLAPFNAFLISQGMKTLALRMERCCDNALAVARHLQKHPQVAFVNYPGLEGSPYHTLAKKYFTGGFGSVFTFGLKGGRPVGAKFVDSLDLVKHVANVGDLRTMVIHPATTTHSQLTDLQLQEAGITPETIRISVGIEGAGDIIADLDTAIEKAVK